MKLNLSLIKKQRIQKGFNINEMANLLGLSDASQYWKREKGHYNFKSTEIAVLSTELDISFHDIFLSESYSKTEITGGKEVS